MKQQFGTLDLSRTRERGQKTDGHQDNYIGHRAKIGVVVPSTNTSVEYDCQQFIVRGVTWHTTRFYIEHADLSDDKNFLHFLDLLRETIGDSIRSLMTCKPDHVMMGMSAETFWGGIEGNDGFVDRIQEMVGHDTGLTTGANAVLAALDALGVPEQSGKTLGIITPYQPVGDKNVRLFFEDAGYEIKHLSVCAAPMRTTRSHWCPNTRSWTSFAKSTATMSTRSSRLARTYRRAAFFRLSRSGSANPYCRSMWRRYGTQCEVAG